ncbi:TPA: hypothetical protein ACH3X2_005398 [Trebouxia sp. C0005]
MENAKLFGVVHLPKHNAPVLMQQLPFIDTALCQTSYRTQFLCLQSQSLAASEPAHKILCWQKPVQVMRCTSFAALPPVHLLYHYGRNSSVSGELTETNDLSLYRKISSLHFRQSAYSITSLP